MKKFVALILIVVLLGTSVGCLAEEWICPSCESSATGNFCSNCGASKPTPQETHFDFDTSDMSVLSDDDLIYLASVFQEEIDSRGLELSQKSNEGSAKEKENAEPVLSGEGWEIVKDYKYRGGIGDSEFYGFVLKNTTDEDKILTGQVLYYDSADNLIGVSDIAKSVVASQYTVYCSTFNDASFDHAVVVPVLSTPTKSFSLDPFIDINISRVSNKLIITVKNNSEFNADSVSFDILYFDENDKIINKSTGYFDDIPAGGQGIKEDPPSYSQKPFSYFEVYISAIHF